MSLASLAEDHVHPERVHVVLPTNLQAESCGLGTPCFAVSLAAVAAIGDNAHISVADQDIGVIRVLRRYHHKTHLSLKSQKNLWMVWGYSCSVYMVKIIFF